MSKSKQITYYKRKKCEMNTDSECKGTSRSLNNSKSRKVAKSKGRKVYVTELIEEKKWENMKLQLHTTETLANTEAKVITETKTFVIFVSYGFFKQEQLL